MKKFTNDNVIIVIGTEGSGKRIRALKYINDDCIVINYDKYQQIKLLKIYI